MSKISETEIKSMTKEQNYMRGYEDGKSDVLDKIRAEIESNMESIIGKYGSNTPARDMPSAKIERNSARMEALEIIDKYKAESEKVRKNDR